MLQLNVRMLCEGMDVVCEHCEESPCAKVREALMECQKCGQFVCCECWNEDRGVCVMCDE